MEKHEIQERKGDKTGNIGAQCNKCDCVLLWNMEHHPFYDAVVVGTCDDCFKSEKHECVNEYTLYDKREWQTIIDADG